MVATNLKAETFKLMDKRSAIETEMDVIIERLCQPGGPGLSGNLIDSEGFPRSDIDIPVVLADRHHLAELRSDYSELTKKIDQNIQILHSARRSGSPSSEKDSGRGEGSVSNQSTVVSPQMSSSDHSNLQTHTPTSMVVDVFAKVPFAVVDEITEGSPSAEDGLQLGDLILKFGNVESGTDLLPRLASEAQINQGREVPVELLRQGAALTIAVTPRTWRGRGLLGCHFRIL
ncbi:unnamed protein product [Rhodiola kirilowii]